MLPLERMKIYSHILDSKRKNKKLFAVLVDPDKTTAQKAEEIAFQSVTAKVDFLFVGSSLLTNGNLDSCIKILKQNSNIRVVLFPGNTLQVSKEADAILLLSLISGRNPDMLIGKHVIAAPMLKESALEIIPTGYMLIDPGHPTSVSYMSNTQPIPHDKNDIAWCTALAGEMLGMKMIFMDAGSGARTPINTNMIYSVRNKINVPLIAGGGIKTPEKALDNCQAGADIIVVGNSIEKNVGLIEEMSAAIHSFEVKVEN
jgi:phosphoglycerol geranylgeranyltransferase